MKGYREIPREATAFDGWILFCDINTQFAPII